MKCSHVWTEKIVKKQYNKNFRCIEQVRKRTCFFCGKKEREVVYVKDPPKKRDEVRWNHMK